jgi:hypothetical protein
MGLPLVSAPSGPLTHYVLLCVSRHSCEENQEGSGVEESGRLREGGTLLWQRFGLAGLRAPLLQGTQC